jgi:hypothetical protein
MKPLFKIFFLIVILTSCIRTVPCGNAEVIPVFIGFSSHDFDTVILRQFKKGGNFTQLIDSSTFVKNGVDSNRFYTFSDTTIIDFDTACCTQNNLMPDYDWELILSHKKDSISISDIESPQTEISCFKCRCVNPINSIVQNGQKVIPVSYQYIRYFNVSGYVNYYKSGYAIFINH